MDIEELIERGETQSVEFKESLGLKDEIGETVSAFSNSDGGTVIIGVSNSSSELRKLAKESGERVYWDEQICEDASLDDISEEKNRQFLRKAKYERRLEIDPDILVKEALERLSLIKGDKLTNASILLFGKEPQKFFLQTKLRCARYKGTTPITFIDLKKKHKSIPRNPLVANAFFLIRNIEQWGEGTNKIKKGAYYVAREHVPKK
ncbi:MAG: RNA-binding domain-containing protein [Halobacteriota archaeon]